MHSANESFPAKFAQAAINSLFIIFQYCQLQRNSAVQFLRRFSASGNTVLDEVFVVKLRQQVPSTSRRYGAVNPWLQYIADLRSLRGPLTHPYPAAFHQPDTSNRTVEKDF